jgi:hypothetical protein
VKNFSGALFVTAALCALAAASPAQAAQHKHVAHVARPAPKTVKQATSDDLYTSRGISGVLALDNLHENGSTCLTCSNGIYGTSGTPNMRSNEF